MVRTKKVHMSSNDDLSQWRGPAVQHDNDALFWELASDGSLEGGGGGLWGGGGSIWSLILQFLVASPRDLFQAAVAFI